MSITIEPVTGLGEIQPGDDLAALVSGRAEIADGDVVVIAQKVVSKAEGALVPLGAEEPVAAARRRLAREQAARVVVDTPGVLVVETAHGLVCANAGIDSSNVPDGWLAVLPKDPDASARALRAAFRDQGVDVGVVVTDTFGRPWRLGQTDVAIGVAGVPPLRDERGEVDREGRPLEVTETALADELAGAADLVRTKSSGVPVVIVRGLDCALSDEGEGAEALRRRATEDLFPRGRGMLAAALAAEEGPIAPGTVEGHGPVAEPGTVGGHGSVAEPGAVIGPEQPTPQPVAGEHLAIVGEVAARAGAELVPVRTGNAAAAPTVRQVRGDRVAAGLVVAALLDLGYAARWRDVDGVLVVEAGEEQPVRSPG
ncbi:coenzyme F420-0:L-glutamate ligase [Egibacter rhizosphaerae]|uniref:Coenzyme F420-0:L-glutamate ligase n=1 Tax=Egibacter rhizosphaerae TaxID=1670831 RepID=A0A411YH37_9ACTN|nr:coenzyme F420-0:L-glutamate ligase [Egibacter rhizosphaerae]QBI20574.1 coenzyme F420-0:L-glutamate ligase [Egibacter rhizosphaerae]